MIKNGIAYEKDWEIVIDKIVDMIYEPINNNKKIYSTLKLIREQFYILFITNISTQTIIRKIMIKLLNKTLKLEQKYNIIDITSIFEQRLSQGTRQSLAQAGTLFENLKANVKSVAPYQKIKMVVSSTTVRETIKLEFTSSYGPRFNIQMIQINHRR